MPTLRPGVVVPAAMLLPAGFAAIGVMLIR
jgi:hypothetical protein